jgi:uncharacterized protein (DUF2062 family)
MDSNRSANIFAILSEGSGPDGESAGSRGVPRDDIRRIIAQGDLAAGISKAVKLGCTHAVVPGSNADAGDLPLLLQASTDHPAALVIGYRNDAAPRHRLRPLLLRLETGLRLRDIDGPRVYPLALIRVIDPSASRRFGDTELLVRAAWAGCPIIETPLPANAPAGHSHPLTIRQILRELAIHARLIARALSGWPHQKYQAGMVPTAPQPFWPRIGRWLNPFAAWRELRRGGSSRNEMAVGLAAGVFIGNMPAWGFHTALSLYVAKRLHLNPLAVMSGSHVSVPPMGPVLVASAMWTGHVILHGVRPTWENITPFRGKFMAHAVPLLLDWTLGAVLIGTALAVIVFVASNFLFRFVERPGGEVRADVATGERE